MALNEKMKKIFLPALLSVLILGCTVRRPPAFISSSALDYTEYQKQGFFLSESNSVSFSYEPIASVSAIQLSGYKVKGSGNKEVNDDAFQTGYVTPYTAVTKEFIKASKEGVLKQLVDEAKSKGANAIINLNFTAKFAVDKEGYSYLQGWSSSGMAIKK
ncbi:uncharacterized protein YbjQ (UPF0145 family) [Pedobacter sp. UYP24]